MSEKSTLNRGQWFVLAAAFLGWMFDGVEIGLFPLVARPALQDLLHIADDSVIAYWNSIIVACFLLGAAAGGLVFGWLGDKIGRVRAMVLSILAYSLFTGACYFVTSAWQLGVCRFLASLGMGGEWSLAVALVVECWPERHRPKLAGAIGAASNIGFLMIALVAMTRHVTITDWRWLMLVGAAPAVLAFLVLMFVPESERWKAAAKKGGRSPIVEIFRGSQLRTTLLAMVFSSIPLIVTWAAVSGWVPVWVDQMTEEAMGKQMLTQESLAKFELTTNHKEKHVLLKESLSSTQWQEISSGTAHAKAFIQVLLAVGAIIGASIAPMVCGRYGRRPIYFALCLLSLVSCAILFRMEHYNGWFMLMVGITGTVTAAFYGWLPLYLPEVFPTRVRATGQGVCYNSGRVVAAGGSLCMGQLVGFFNSDYGRAGSTIALIYVVGLALIWFAPETRGQPLPD